MKWWKGAITLYRSDLQLWERFEHNNVDAEPAEEVHGGGILETDKKLQSVMRGWERVESGVVGWQMRWRWKGREKWLRWGHNRNRWVLSDALHSCLMHAILLWPSENGQEVPNCQQSGTTFIMVKFTYHLITMLTLDSTTPFSILKLFAIPSPSKKTRATSTWINDTLNVPLLPTWANTVGY